MGLGAWIQLLEVIDVAAQELGILQAVLHCGCTPEGQHCSARLQPPNMYLQVDASLSAWQSFRQCPARQPSCKSKHVSTQRRLLLLVEVLQGQQKGLWSQHSCWRVPQADAFQKVTSWQVLMRHHHAHARLRALHIINETQSALTAEALPKWGTG